MQRPFTFAITQPDCSNGALRRFRIPLMRRYLSAICREANEVPLCRVDLDAVQDRIVEPRDGSIEFSDSAGSTALL